MRKGHMLEKVKMLMISSIVLNLNVHYVKLLETSLGKWLVKDFRLINDFGEADKSLLII